MRDCLYRSADAADALFSDMEIQLQLFQYVGNSKVMDRVYEVEADFEGTDVRVSERDHPSATIDPQVECGKILPISLLLKNGGNYVCAHWLLVAKKSDTEAFLFDCNFGGKCDPLYLSGVKNHLNITLSLNLEMFTHGVYNDDSHSIDGRKFDLCVPFTVLAIQKLGTTHAFEQRSLEVLHAEPNLRWGVSLPITLIRQFVALWRNKDLKKYAWDVTFQKLKDMQSSSPTSPESPRRTLMSSPGSPPSAPSAGTPKDRQRLYDPCVVTNLSEQFSNL